MGRRFVEFGLAFAYCDQSNGIKKLAIDYDRIETAIRFISTHYDTQPTLDEIASAVGLSAFHFHRLFRRWAGITPKQFLQSITVEHAKRLLADSSLLDTSLELGLSGPGRLHDHFVKLEAVTPGQFKTLGKDLTIEYGTCQSPFGLAFIAATDRGICQLAFITQNSANEPLERLRKSWPNAYVSVNHDKIETLGETIFNADPDSPPTLSVIVKGSKFQVRVWKSLLQIPSGKLCSYSQIAQNIQKPSASRAVANAIGANPIAYLIPCHRVIRSTGTLGGYHWGIERKLALQAYETAHYERTPRSEP